MITDYAIVFVANDHVYNQTVAFLESVYQNSPNIPLICIPYDDQLAKTNVLSEVYGFSYHNDFDITALMEICTIMIGRPLTGLRKMGVFTAPVKEFMCLDTDVIVLQDLSRLFGHVGEEGGADILHFDLSPNMTYFDPQDPLIAHSKEICAGTYISSRRIFNYERHVTTIMSHYPAFKRLAVVANYDQPFGSFVFDIERRNYQSIETVSDYTEHTWYRKDFMWQDNSLVERKSGRKVPLIHFAGIANLGGINASAPYSDLFEAYQTDGHARVLKHAIK